MLPTYRQDDLLLGLRWFTPKIGQVVVAHTDRPLIKRITGLEPDRVWLRGDNPQASTDSRHFGAVPRSRLEAVIIARLASGDA